MAKVVIIGAGPAGVSAALYARRGGAEVTVVSSGKDTGSLTKAHLIENYYGLAEPVSGAELFQRGIQGAKRIGVEFIEDDVVAVTFAEDFHGFQVETKQEKYDADIVILAAGAAHKTLPVPGIREFEGKGVSYCAICDAFFYRQKKVAVIGAGEYALHEASALLPHAAQVTLLTNGEEPGCSFPESVVIKTAKLSALEGSGRVQQVRFQDGSVLPVDGVFLAVGVAGSTELARKMGIMLEGNAIKVDEHMATNIPGIFAAGDCTSGLRQVAKAVYQGAEAGLAALRFLREKDV
ncbi:MAG: NAD(P)/FAD-dependent oxidoreductase [Selenomonas sp.]|uniref:NAD(P)/FAD-dependent oxidoreductase n=1 Tax=Selenomonas sp. TaxID=2053611 RepID=UPI0025EB0C89|nr:NAD(P)/FAD-dependent oxidoreductase [Selenomonas sp.]MCR5439052.1 NAD(P)/FAD-dependent oxidoreductase [Selenomonas sp.]